MKCGTSTEKRLSIFSRRITSGRLRNHVHHALPSDLVLIGKPAWAKTAPEEGMSAPSVTAV
jgi:hypothetical protein